MTVQDDNDDALDALALARVALTRPPLQEGSEEINSIIGDRDEADLIKLLWVQAQLVAAVIKDWHTATLDLVEEVGGSVADVDTPEQMLDAMRDIVLEVEPEET